MQPDVAEPRPEVTGSPPDARAKRWLSVLGLVALVGSALFGGNVWGVRERFLGSETPEAKAPAASRGTGGVPAAAVTTVPPKETVLRSHPWWQGVTKLEGSGSMTAPAFTVDPGAIQWRVRWTCQTGRLQVRAAEQRRAVVDASCPGSEIGYGTRTGSVSLEVTADGPWQLQVDQQIDVPLNEPPLPAMAAPGALKVASGSFYRVDQVGMGTVTIYRLPDGSHALRLDDFFVTANSDLELQLSPLEAPRTTEQVANARSGTIAALDVTAGAFNFKVPAELDPAKYRSLVIWCERTSNAYAAASLAPA